MQTDKRLAKRASNGDERAFAAIFRRYHQDLYRYCLAILRDPEDVQDALQNTMVSALKALPGESREIELKPWLYRIAHNESIDLVRRRRDGLSLDPELTAAGPDLAREAELRDRLGRLLADIGELPERQRGALLMRELGGLGFEQIGAALGCTAAVARQTTYEARLGLREFEAGREMDCVAATKALSDADGRVARRRDLRAHLRDCPGCTAFQAEIKGRRRDLAALSPLPLVLGAGLLKGILGGGAAGATGGGLAGSVALKATATVAVVAALGVGAERGGLIDPVLPGGGNGPSQAAAEDATAGPEAQAAAAPAAASGGDLASSPAGNARAVAARGNGASVAKPAPATEAPTGAPEAAPAPTNRSETANGKGRGGAHPAASQKGQQNAAAHKTANQGRGGEHSARTEHPVHPTHPAKPAHPATSAKPEKPASAQAPDPVPEDTGEAFPEAEKPASGAAKGKQSAPASGE